MKLAARHTRTRNTLRFAAVAAAAALVLAACGSSSDDEPAASDTAAASGDLGALTVQLSWIKNAEFAGEFMADSKGYYKDAGFSSVNLLTGPVAQEEIVATGKADFGLSNAVSTGAAIANSQFPLKIVGTTYQKNPFSILSLGDKGNIKTPQDMIGKKIGVQDPNLSLFKALLKANNIDEDQVTIVPNGFDVAPLEDKKIDGLVAYITNESLLVKGHGFDTVDLPFADNGLPFVAESVMTTDDILKKSPEKVKAFLEAEIKGWKDACTDIEGGAKLAVDVYGKDIDPALELPKEIEQAQAQCDDLVNSDETKANGLFTISPAAIAANITSLKTAGIDITADQLFDMGPLTELLKEKPELTK
ncbi:MAG: transporter substrate-binding protein [Nocardioidaceae bacterium]|nr:transporter substrate-binding protein [Nocardioidaceae bacterium]